MKFFKICVLWERSKRTWLGIPKFNPFGVAQIRSIGLGARLASSKDRRFRSMRTKFLEELQSPVGLPSQGSPRLSNFIIPHWMWLCIQNLLFLASIDFPPQDALSQKLSSVKNKLYDKKRGRYQSEQKSPFGQCFKKSFVFLPRRRSIESTTYLAFELVLFPSFERLSLKSVNGNIPIGQLW